MKPRSPIGIISLISLVIVLFSLLIVALPISTALADSGGIAMTGTFSGQKYEMPRDTSVSSSEIYITVINEYPTDTDIVISYKAPFGVIINLSDTDFTLSPGGNQLISIEIQTTDSAVSGNLSITATPFIENQGNVQMKPEITHTASLTVIGDSADVTLLAVSPDDTPVTAELRLFKWIEGRYQEVAYDLSASSLSAVVAPGTFKAQAYVGGQLLDEETFEIAANDNKTIKLTAGTIYFENPGILRYYNEDTGALAYVNIYYTVRNVYEPVDNVTIKLIVSLNGTTIEEKEHMTIPTLVIGRASGSLDYYPISGDGEYQFVLQLLIDGSIYTSAPVMTVDINDNPIPTSTHSNGSSTTDDKSNMSLIVGVVCAVILLLDIAFYMIYRSRKAKRTH